jgi:hypothetical protein
MTRQARARVGVIVVAGLVLVAGGACEQKKAPPPAGNPYQVGSVIINLPPSVHIPEPQGAPDAPTVNAMKCNFVVDRQINFMTKAKPELKPAVVTLKPGIMQECQTKWTQEQYDCMVKAQSLEQMVQCKHFQRP